MEITEKWGRPLGYAQLAVTNAAQALPSIPAGAEIAVMSVDTNNLRWRDDGSDPTASVGIPMKTTDLPLIYRGDLGRVKVIEETGAPILNICYYGTEPAAT